MGDGLPQPQGIPVLLGEAAVVHPQQIAVFQADDAGECHYAGHPEVLGAGPGPAAVLAVGVAHIAVFPPRVHGGEHEQPLLARLVRKPVQAGAVDQSVPLRGRALYLPVEASVPAEREERSRSAVAVRPGAHHRLPVLHQDRGRVAVIEFRGAGRDDDLALFLAGNVRPGQVGFVPLCRRREGQCKGDEE